MLNQQLPKCEMIFEHEQENIIYDICIVLFLLL